ncbi:MAG: hypothetical protein IJD30_06545 [Clostridia bacterium]|nr:hypothetical protein [Clostridia bacterium]
MDIRLELSVDIIAQMIKRQISMMDIDLGKIAECRAIIMLEKIKAVVGNDALSDFDAMEEIVNIFEEFGVSAGDRHDFG